MAGSDERTPSPADRPPASRVGDELARRADELERDGEVSDEVRARAEREAYAEAVRKGWDQQQTAREGGRPSPTAGA